MWDEAVTYSGDVGGGRFMRVGGANVTAGVGASHGARRMPAGAFMLPDTESPSMAGPAAAMRGIGGIDALLALQGLEPAGEQRRRAVKRGRAALDVLDELKIGVLGGTLTPATLNRLRDCAVGLRNGSGDAGLDGVLNEIALRVEVEIAKMAAR